MTHFLDTIAPPERNLILEQKAKLVLTEYIQGCTLLAACEKAGMSVPDFYIFIRRSPTLEALYHELKDLNRVVLKERLQANIIDTALNIKDVELSKWLLERLFNEEFSTRKITQAERPRDIRRSAQEIIAEFVEEAGE